MDSLKLKDKLAKMITYAFFCIDTLCLFFCVTELFKNSD